MQEKQILSFVCLSRGWCRSERCYILFLLRGCYPELILPARNHGMFGIDVDSTRSLMPKLCNRQVIITNGNWVSIDSRLFASLATQKARC